MPAHKWDSTGSIEVDLSSKTPKKMDVRGVEKPFSRYNDAMKNFLPVRKRKSDDSHERLMPSGDASLLSYLWAIWLSPLVWKAWRVGLNVDDLWKLQVPDRCETVVVRLERAWAEELKKGPVEASLFKACFRSIKTRFLVSVAFMMVSTVFQFLAPTLLVKSLLDYVAADKVEQSWGLTMVTLLLLVLFLRNVTQNAMLAMGAHTGTRVIGGLQLLAYKKLLEWRSLHSDTLVGQLTNFCANDMDRVLEAVYLAPMITSVPVMFVACMAYAIVVMGAWVLLGILTIFIFYPVMSGLAAFVSRSRLVTVRLTDKRVTMMEELAGNIRLIKMYAWEQFFSDRISRVRGPEQAAQQKAAFLQSITMTMTGSVAILAAVVTFLCYSLAGNPLKAPEVFTVFSIFGAFQFSLGILPQTVRVIAEANVALRRLKELLLFDHPASSLPLATVDDKNAIEICHATFAWDTVSWEPPREEPRKPRKKTKDKKEKKKSKTKKPKRKGEDQQKLKDDVVVKASVSNGATSVRTGEGSAEERVVLGDKKDLGDSEKDFKTVLWDVNVTVRKGGLVGLCGVVGCGKSSLISAISGNLRQCAGERRLKGRLAVVSQAAWIFNDTLKENILFGLPHDAVRYQRVVDACCLTRDIESFPNRDDTEIGERGVNLSGGQKQRVNLARAVYADRDIYLLDDCLSAVDPEVAQKIFDECVRGVLEEKTVLLATHSIQLLEKCDYIYHFKDGRIVDEGSYQDLVGNPAGAFMSLIRYDRTRSKKDAVDDAPRSRSRAEAARQEELQRMNSVVDAADQSRKLSEKEGEANETLENDGRIIVEEGKGRGAVTFWTYWGYFKRWGNMCAAFSTLAIVAVYSMSRLLIPVWLQLWIDDGRRAEATNMTAPNVSAVDGNSTNLTAPEALTELPAPEDLSTYYETVFAALTCVVLSVGLAQGYVMCRQLLIASSRLHGEMLASILRAPISFFDTTPTGRILNRFSRDVDELDVRMPFFCSMVAQGILNVFLQLVSICIYYPHFIAPFCAIFGLFVLLDYWLNVGIREVKRIDNVTRSFVLQHIDATVSGLPVIHSYNKEKDFQDKFSTLVNSQTSSVLLYRHTSRWFQCRLELLGNFAILVTALIVVLDKDGYSPAMAGVALNFVFQSCGFLPFLLRVKSEFQARMTSVERMLEYIEDVPQEALAVSYHDGVLEGWPAKGEIEFTDFSCRYRPNLPLVLKNVNLHIQAGEKVGIVGRTGAGKSSLIYALLRLVEPYAGKIRIDSVDIGEVGLKRLRESIAVIPQDPTLFRGTIRSNLDPFGEQSDEAIWQALEQAHLKAVVQSMGGQLDSPIGSVEASSDKANGGGGPTGVHFSVGQRQLLCLARALLKNSKILVLDEATASVDVRTDALIQETLRAAFASATVLTIAHRLHTVLHYDKILVMEDGSVVEFGKPTELMTSERGTFKAIMATIGITSVEQFHDYSPENLPFIDADSGSSDEDQDEQYLSCGTEIDD